VSGFAGDERVDFHVVGEIPAALGRDTERSAAGCFAQCPRIVVRSFTTGDGLSDNRLHRIILDCAACCGSEASTASAVLTGRTSSLWRRARPAVSSINDLLETPDGDFWLATNGGGVIRFPISSARLAMRRFPSAASRPQTA
jgi:hypothetical protein